MEFVYNKADDIYEPFIVKIEGKEYKLQYPLTTEKMQKYWSIGDEATKRTENGKPEGLALDEMLNCMLDIPMDILKDMDHRFKGNLNIELSQFIGEAQKKNQKSQKQSK
jgi:hypothetical protein